MRSFQPSYGPAQTHVRVQLAKMPTGFAHAATHPAAGSFDALLKLGSDVEYLYLGVAAPGKDLRQNGDISTDADVWLFSNSVLSGGVLWARGEFHAGEAAVKPHDVLTLRYDAGAATLRFLRGGQLLGQHMDVALNPKIVVTMGKKGNGAELVQL